MSIHIRRPDEIAKIATASKVVAKTLDFLSSKITDGISTKELNRLGEDYIKALGARPAFKGLYGFPAGICISVNEVIIHGIPDDYKLKSGDIVGLDIGAEIDGWYGDAARTFGVGNISKNDQKLIDCSHDSLMHAVSIIEEGMSFKKLAQEIEDFIISRGFVPLMEYCGHGIGRSPHEEPDILNYVDNTSKSQKLTIREGMVFCIEPMICHTSGIPKVLSDHWSVVSEDEKNGSHWEHTIAIVNKRAKILSTED